MFLTKAYSHLYKRRCKKFVTVNAHLVYYIQLDVTNSTNANNATTNYSLFGKTNQFRIFVDSLDNDVDDLHMYIYVTRLNTQCSNQAMQYHVELVLNHPL